jgi:hypothetical protein
MRTAIMILMVAVIIPATVSAQNLDSIYKFDTVIFTGERVRIQSEQDPGNWMEGRIVSQDFFSLKLLVEADTLSVPLAEIEKMEISRGTSNNAGKGALAGGVVVGFSGLMLGASLKDDPFYDVSGEDLAALTVAAFGVGALVGGIIGALSSTEKWDEVESIQVNPFISPGRAPGIAVSMRFR